MTYQITAMTDQGPYRKTNQDSILLREKRNYKKSIVLAVICDGMGGLEFGEIASQMAVTSFANWFDAFEMTEESLSSIDNLLTQWKILIRDINTKIYDYASLAGTRMGTTLSAIIFLDKKYIIAHVGDSRIYKVTSAEIQQLTDDHSVVAEEVRRGRITIEQAQKDKRRHLLTRCIGVEKKINPQFLFGDVYPNDSFLICSDGLWNRVANIEIKKLADAGAMEPDRLIRLARARNEKDNISIITVTGKNSYNISNVLKNDMVIRVIFGVIIIVVGFLIWSLVL